MRRTVTKKMENMVILNKDLAAFRTKLTPTPDPEVSQNRETPEIVLDHLKVEDKNSLEEASKIAFSDVPQLSQMKALLEYNGN